MPTLAFATKGAFRGQDRLRFTRFSRAEYYEGEISALDDDQPLDLQVEKGLDAPYMLALTKARTPYTYRRTAAHIERDRADICIVHYVVSGSIRATHSGARAEVGPGQFIIFRSNAPYALEYRPAGNDQRSMFYVSLPPETVLRHFAGRSILGRTIAPPAGHHCIASDLFEFIFERGAHLTPPVASSLVSALIKEIAQIPTSADLNTPPVTSIQDYRLEKIWSYLALHFTNPDLTASMVAEACRISPRYLSFLLASSGTSFTEVLWRLRMEKAERWLRSPALQDMSIGRLALQAGYKSGSHFAHVFRGKHGCTPRDYRKRRLASPVAVSDEAADLDDTIVPVSTLRPSWLTAGPAASSQDLAPVSC